MEQPTSGGLHRQTTSEGRKDKDSSHSKTNSKSRSNPESKQDIIKSGPSREKVEIPGEKRTGAGHSRPKGDNVTKDEKRGPSREKVEIPSKAPTTKDEKREREKHEASRDKTDSASKTSGPKDEKREKEERRGHSRDKIDTSKKAGAKDEQSSAKHRSADRFLAPDSSHDASHSKSPGTPRISSRSKSRPKSERIPSSPVSPQPEVTSPKKATSPSHKVRPKSERIPPSLVKTDTDAPKPAAAKQRRGTTAGDRMSSPELGRKEARNKDERKEPKREGEQQRIVSPKSNAAGASKPAQARPVGRRAPSLAEQRQW